MYLFLKYSLLPSIETRDAFPDLNHQLAQRLHEGGKEAQTEEALKRYQRCDYCWRRLEFGTSRGGNDDEASIG